MRTLSIIYIIAAVSLVTACERGDINETTEIDHEVTALRTDLDACNLEVLPSDDDTATVEVDVRYWFREPDITVDTMGDILVIDVACDGPCACDGAITAWVPAHIEIDADNGSGNIRIDNIEGSVIASSGSGNVAVEETTGALELESGSGNVTASNISSQYIDAHSGSGNVFVRCADKPEEVKVDAGSGNVNLFVPRGVYDVDASSGSGRAKVQGLVNSSDAENIIRAETGSGNVTVKGL